MQRNSILEIDQHPFEHRLPFVHYSSPTTSSQFRFLGYKWNGIFLRLVRRYSFARLPEFSPLKCLQSSRITHVDPSYWLTCNSAALAVAPKAHAMARIAAVVLTILLLAALLR